MFRLLAGDTFVLLFAFALVIAFAFLTTSRAIFTACAISGAFSSNAFAFKASFVNVEAAAALVADRFAERSRCNVPELTASVRRGDAVSVDAQ